MWAEAEVAGNDAGAAAQEAEHPQPQATPVGDVGITLNTVCMMIFSFLFCKLRVLYTRSVYLQ